MTAIRCTCLFSLASGTASRREPTAATAQELKQWQQQRRQQNNFDTILQVISIRSQPEDITEPQRTVLTDKQQAVMGAVYQVYEQLEAWQFTFTVQHASVFAADSDEFAALDLDCDAVPMFSGLAEHTELPDYLDTSPELRNIWFETI